MKLIYRKYSVGGWGTSRNIARCFIYNQYRHSPEKQCNFVPLLAVFVGGEIVDMISNTGAVAKLVLLVLLAFSLISWAIILTKWSLLRRAQAQSGRFVRAFRKAQRLQDIAAVAEQFKPSPLVGVFEGGYEEYNAGRPLLPARSTQSCLDPAWHADRRVGRNYSPGAQPAMACDHRRGHSVCRIVRHGLGHH